MKMNAILLQQIEQCNITTEDLSENINQLLGVINLLYDKYEQDRAALLKTVQLCSSEMADLNSKLLKESKELRTLFETMREVYFSVNMETSQLLQISKACEEVYGYPVEKFIENPNLWSELVIAKDRHVVARAADKIACGLPYTFSYRICRKDGCVRWMETKITPTLNQEGNIVRVDGFTSDITVRKEAVHMLCDVKKQRTILVGQLAGNVVLDKGGIGLT